ncbi:hypothetical protein, partial [Escherichia coli]|uniref:hypothetical protein n=1 Tax=Escherichia coli TaxID=562 RepID=UPI001BAFF4B8
FFFFFREEGVLRYVQCVSWLEVFVKGTIFYKVFHSHFGVFGQPLFSSPHGNLKQKRGKKSPLPFFILGWAAAASNKT